MWAADTNMEMNKAASHGPRSPGQQHTHLEQCLCPMEKPGIKTYAPKYGSSQLASNGQNHMSPVGCFLCHQSDIKSTLNLIKSGNNSTEMPLLPL